MKISWCSTSSKEDIDDKCNTLKSIKSQTIPVHEIIITNEGNIAQGRNAYLKKASGDVIASFDFGCVYEPQWTEKLLRKMEEEQADIVFGIVQPLDTNTSIKKFCASRLPDYNKFTEEDYNNFIPSNRQVIFKRKVIEKIGFVPPNLWRSDDTYWFRRAREEGLKFAYCKEAVVQWEMKENLKSYLKTIYVDTKCDTQYGIKPFRASKRNKKSFTPYFLMVFGLAVFAKIFGKIAGHYSLESDLKNIEEEYED